MNPDSDLCWAGRDADFGGRWTKPCPSVGRNLIGAPGLLNPIQLCDPHFAEVNAAGLVEEPFMDPDEFDRRMPGFQHGERR